MSLNPSKNNAPLLWAQIDLAALKNNLRAVRKTLGPRPAGILAIVKADAYGHGMIPVSRALWGEGVRFFGVANIEEAVLLRKTLPKASILVLGVFHPSQIGEYILKKIIPTISSPEDAVLLHRKLGRRRFPVHVKIDTGMGRLGLPHGQTEKFFTGLKKMPSLEVQGVYTHFSSADHESRQPTRAQLTLFSKSLKIIRALGFSPKYTHASNSMGMLRFREARFNLVRPGIVLYGLKPSPRAKLPAGVGPVLVWKTRISFLKKFTPGQTVSYGRTHRVEKNTLIAALPVGYSHGYRIAFSNRAFVLVRGRRCPVAGRVTMDQTLVDVGRVPGVKRWDEAVLIGSQGRERISAEDLAGIAQTIPYEIVCGIHSRVPRVYR